MFVEVHGDFRLAVFGGRIVQHRADGHRVADIGKAGRGWLDHHGLVDLERALSAAELIAQRLRHGHEPVAREAVGRFEGRRDISIGVRFQRAVPICGAEEVPPHVGLAAF